MTNLEADVIRGLFIRYQHLIAKNADKLSGLPNKCDGNHLLRLCKEAIENAHEYPFDKMCRWMGFVQGVLAVQGIIDVDKERDYTRPLFHALYGREVPTF